MITRSTLIPETDAKEGLSEYARIFFPIVDFLINSAIIVIAIDAQHKTTSWAWAI